MRENDGNLAVVEDVRSPVRENGGDISHVLTNGAMCFRRAAFTPQKCPCETDVSGNSSDLFVFHPAAAFTPQQGGQCRMHPLRSASNEICSLQPPKFDSIPETQSHSQS